MRKWRNVIGRCMAILLLFVLMSSVAFAQDFDGLSDSDLDKRIKSLEDLEKDIKDPDDLRSIFGEQQKADDGEGLFSGIGSYVPDGTGSTVGFVCVVIAIVLFIIMGRRRMAHNREKYGYWTRWQVDRTESFPYVWPSRRKAGVYDPSVNYFDKRVSKVIKDLMFLIKRIKQDIDDASLKEEFDNLIGSFVATNTSGRRGAIYHKWGLTRMVYYGSRRRRRVEEFVNKLSGSEPFDDEDVRERTIEILTEGADFLSELRTYLYNFSTVMLRDRERLFRDLEDEITGRFGPGTNVDYLREGAAYREIFSQTLSSGLKIKAQKVSQEGVEIAESDTDNEFKILVGSAPGEEAVFKADVTVDDSEGFKYKLELLDATGNVIDEYGGEHTVQAQNTGGAADVTYHNNGKFTIEKQQLFGVVHAGHRLTMNLTVKVTHQPTTGDEQVLKTESHVWRFDVTEPQLDLKIESVQDLNRDGTVPAPRRPLPDSDTGKFRIQSGKHLGFLATVSSKPDSRFFAIWKQQMPGGRLEDVQTTEEQIPAAPNPNQTHVYYKLDLLPFGNIEGSAIVELHVQDPSGRVTNQFKWTFIIEKLVAVGAGGPVFITPKIVKGSEQGPIAGSDQRAFDAEIDQDLFFEGDVLHTPGAPVEILWVVQHGTNPPQRLHRNNDHILPNGRLHLSQELYVHNDPALIDVSTMVGVRVKNTTSGELRKLEWHFTFRRIPGGGP